MPLGVVFRGWERLQECVAKEEGNKPREREKKTTMPHASSNKNIEITTKQSFFSLSLSLSLRLFFFGTNIFFAGLLLCYYSPSPSPPLRQVLDTFSPSLLLHPSSSSSSSRSAPEGSLKLRVGRVGKKNQETKEKKIYILAVEMQAGRRRNLERCDGGFWISLELCS